MNIKRKPYSAKGAVLIMVLTVMFVLIFLLAGAVAVVYTSNNRVMMQYEESQAYYTARSVIDIYREMILESSGSSSTTGSYYELSADKTGVVSSGSSGPYRASIGRALELDLYRVPVAVGVDPSNPTTYNPYLATELKTITVAADKEAQRKLCVYSRNITGGTSGKLNNSTFENYNKQYYVETSFNDRIEKEASGNSSITKIKPSENGGIRAGIDDTLVYYVNYNGTSSDFKKYQIPNSGATVSDGSNELADPNSTVKLSVQVLDRIYSYGDGTDLCTGDKVPQLITDGKVADWQEAFNNGKRENDVFKIKVTAEVQYLGEIVTTSVIYDNGKRPNKGSKIVATRAIVSLDDINGDNTLIALGGGSSLARTREGVNGSLNDANTSGDIMLQSSFSVNSTAVTSIYLGSDEKFFVRGDLKVDTNQQAFQVKKGATVFSAGTISFGSANGSKIGDEASDEQMNIIAKKLVIGDQNNASISGQGIFEEIDLVGDGVNNGYIKLTDSGTNGNNYYCNTLYVGENFIDSSGATPKFKESSGKNVFDVIGNNSHLYAKKIVSFRKKDVGVTLDHDPWYFVPDEDAVLAEYDASSFDLTGSGDKIKAGTYSDIKIDYDTAPYSDGVKTITLPVEPIVNGTGSVPKEIKLDTVQNVYEDYFNDAGTDGTATWNTTGDMTLTYNPSNTSTYAADLKDFVKKHIKSSEDLFKNNVENKDFNTFAFGKSATNTADCPVWNNQVKVPPAALGGTSTNLLGSSNYNRYVNDNFYLDSGEGNGSTTWLVDTTNKDIYMTLGKNAAANGSTMPVYTGKFVVYGDHDLIICVPSATTDAKVAIGSTASNKYFQVLDYDVIYGSGNIGSVSKIDLRKEISPGNANPDLTTPPNIYWYFSSKIKEVEFESYCLPSMGYVLAPLTNFTQINQQTLDTPSVQTKDFPNVYRVSTDTTRGIGFYGSVLCAQYKSTHTKPGLVYIPRDGGGGGGGSHNPGDPLYKWPGQYYSMD